MKFTLRTTSLIFALGFAFATLVQFAGFVTIPGIPTAGLAGGLVVSCVLVFMLGDYARKPAFRVRRTASDSNGRGTDGEPAGWPGAGLDLHHPIQVDGVSAIAVSAAKRDAHVTQFRLSRPASPS